MKKLVILCIIFTIALTQAEPYYHSVFADSNDVKIDNIDLPGIKSLTAKNGLRLFYIKDELPRTIIVLSAGFGKLYEDNTNAGIADFLAQTLSLAGSKKYPADKLHSTIESIGGRFRVEASFEETYIIIEVMEKYSALAFEMLTDIVLNPNLDSKIIENARSLILEDLRRKQDSPDMLAFEKAREIIFNGTGYGAYPTEKSINSITVSDLENTLNKYFTAKNIIVGTASSLGLNEVENNLNRFNALKEGSVMNYTANISFLKVSMAEKTKNIYLLPKDIPQAVIVVGSAAPGIKDPDFYALSLMNDILGGSSFNSRLMHEIRVKRGLAYAVQSVVRFRKHTGVFLAYAQTRSETADTALSLMLENIENMSKYHVKDEELKLAKDSIKNSYIFEFDTPASILRKYSFLSYNGLPDSFLFNYVKGMNSVSKNEIQKSSGELFGKGLIKLIIGRKELEKSLSKFGNVVIIE
ncbi:MAG: insulinase family protein [Spirochaetes bacterium]|nr:insulinase family protein [Spirochaetota bacterium]